MNHIGYSSYESEQIMNRGKRLGVEKKITMKNGKGMKVVRHMVGNKVKQFKQPLTRKEIKNIHKGNYMPKLFTSMAPSMRNKTKKVKRTSM